MSRYIYSCQACGGSVVKTACQTVKDKEGKHKDHAGLGGWACQKCGSGVKDARRINNV